MQSRGQRQLPLPESAASSDSARVDANGELTAQMLANGLERQPTAAFYWLAPDQRKPTANVPV